MRKTCLIISALFLIALSCSDDKPVQPPTGDLLERLEALPGTEVTEISPPSGYSRAFQILVDQPLDHDNPFGPTFQQLVYLSHLDEAAPTVMHISGYGIGNNAIYEAAALLQANQVFVGHRFFSGARPDQLDWQYLNIRQAAADHHKIVALLKQIYTGKWVNSGASKGGMTATFHRRYYPADVRATIAYVAPYPSGTEDPRYDQFLAQAGEEDCRDRIKTFQRLVLEDREQIIPLMTQYAQSSGLTFNLDYGLMLEYCVLEFPFSFWQYGPSNCSTLPGAGASAQNLFGRLQSEVGMDYLSEEYFTYYEPFYYQAYTELGYYPLNTSGLEDLLESAEFYSYSILAPPGIALNFNPATMQEIVAWLQNEGDRIIYIYGGNDPWTAGAIELSGAAEALRIIQPGKDHGVRIADLDEQALVYSRLEDWLEIDIEPPVFMNMPSGPPDREEAAIFRK